MDGGEVDEQPLFSENQTDIYVPPPVKDVRRLILDLFVPHLVSIADSVLSRSQGKVPKNNFGNIDLFVPSMLPEGAVHLPSASSPARTSLPPRLRLTPRPSRRQGGSKMRQDARHRLRRGHRASSLTDSALSSAS